MNCIRPIHINDNVYSCRNCECCVVERANSLRNRIINELGYTQPGDITYFVTLTYINDYLPYILPEDLDNGQAIIRRGYNVLDDGSISSEILDDKSSYSTKWYPSIDISEYKNSVYVIKKGTGKKYPAKCDMISVIYYPDIQLFLKRLNKSISKVYGYSRFRFFLSCEVGENTYRSHFHFLFTTSIPQEVFKNYIMSCWSYCDFDELDRHLSRYTFRGRKRSWFEVALRPAEDVSSYVVDGFNLPPFYKLPLWRQKKTHSKYYGFLNPTFSLRAVYAAAREKNLQYYREYYDEKKRQYINGYIQYPSYVIRRYFPIIKRYAWLRSDDFFYLCENIAGNFSKYRSFSGSQSIKSRQELLKSSLFFSKSVCEIFDYLQYDNEDILNLINICWRMYLFALELSISFYDYLILYQSVYVTLPSQRIKLLHDEDWNFVSSFRYYINLDNLVTKIDVTSVESDLIFSDILGIVQTSFVLKFCKNWVDPVRSRLLRQFENNKYNKKRNSYSTTYKPLLYGST